MPLLITRPKAAAAELATRLEALGHTVLLDPLLSVELLDPPLTDLDGVQAIAVTSSNALHSLAPHPKVLTRLATMPLFAVGPATATLARTMGFTHIHEGPGDAAGMAAYVRSTLRAGNGSLLYLRGETTAYDLARDLGSHGLTVQTAVVYRTVPASALLPATLEALAGAGIDGVILLSARTAQTYAKLVIQNNQLKNINNTTHYCLSDAIAQELAPLGLTRICVARHPKIEELLALVGSAAKCLP
jgi:uroporphyrinogen-III synthase